MRGLSATQILLLAAVAVSPCWGQTPTITKIQASFVGGQPADVGGITSGMSLQGGFTLYINGTFNPNAFINATWYNPSTNFTTVFTKAAATVTPTQVILPIPNTLFQTPVSSPITVIISVLEQGGSSNSTFLINPPLAAVQPILPAGTLNVPYSANFITGGSAPFQAATTQAVPPGLNPNGIALAGTPLQTGVFNFQTLGSDFWGNEVQGSVALEIVDVPKLTSVVPNSAGVGSPDVSIVVIGSNFVDQASAGEQTIPGSQVQWTGNGPTTLATTFIDSTQLIASIPSFLLGSIGTAGITVVQPSGATSNQLPFNILGPVISAVTPSSVPAGSNTTTLTVTGANFVAAGESPSDFALRRARAIPGGGSTVFLNGVAFATTFINSGTLTISVPASMLISPATYNVQVFNPSGPGSNIVPFSVLAPTITTLSSSSAAVGAPAFALTATGANYLAGSQLVFRGTTLSPTVVTSTTLTVTVPASLLTTAGQANVQVLNPGGTLSNIATFTIGTLTPTLTSLSPGSAAAGSTGFQLSVAGTNFVSGAQVSWNSTPLATSFGSSSALTATVPSNLLVSAGVVNVQVSNPGGAVSNVLPFNVLRPVISSLSPSFVAAGSPTFNLVVSGSSFVAGSQVSLDGSPLSTTFGSASLLTASVPAALVAGPKTAAIVVTNPGGSASAASAFNVNGSLQITTTSLPAGAKGASYAVTFTGKGGTPPYTWAASGFPSGLTFNTSTGVLSGVLQASGSFTVTVVLQDAAHATVTAQFPLTVSAPPVPVTVSGNLPQGTVGVAYSGSITGHGGNGSFTISLAGGSLPDGLTLSPGGGVSGTPKTPGSFSFSAAATDSDGSSGSGSFTIIILAAPLNITGGPGGSVPVGTPVSFTFGGTGGVPPYRFTPGSGLPPGMSFAKDTLSGTPTTVGTFSFSITLADSVGGVVTKGFSLVVIPPTTPTITVGGTVGDGKVGVPYVGQLSASGGTGPYTFSGTGLPDGLALSTSGAITGTPTTAGPFSLTVTATDSKGILGSNSFAITVAPADVKILTVQLPDGVVDAGYSVTLSASGGVPPYSWTVTGLPDGVTANGPVISGTPRTPGSFTVTVTVKDSAPGSTPQTKTFNVNVVAAPLVITTASLPNGTVGTAYSASVGATGGTTPLAFSATGLPDGLSISAAGAITGTPTAPGAANIVVTVKDKGGASTSKNFAVSFVLPATPPLGFAGISPSAGALQQLRVGVSLGNTFPVDVVVTLTLTFTPDSGADDPTVVFASGGRTARITVPAGATNGATDVGVQTGTVAGVITITAQMQASGQDVTPSPAPRTTTRIAAGAPVIISGSLTAVRNATGFTVTLNGYVTDREMTQAVFQFTAGTGANLQTTTLTVPLDATFAQYFNSAGATATGSQFTYTQPFTLTGSTQAVVSVTVTLSNKIGQSAPATASLN